jgi:hypothetical protein
MKKIGIRFFESYNATRIKWFIDFYF